MISSFLVLVTKWQVMPFRDIGNKRENQSGANGKMGIKRPILSMLTLKFF